MADEQCSPLRSLPMGRVGEAIGRPLVLHCVGWGGVITGCYKNNRGNIKEEPHDVRLLGAM